MVGIVHLVRTENFPKDWRFLPPDTHTYVCVSEVRNVSFSENFAYVVNEWSVLKLETFNVSKISHSKMALKYYRVMTFPRKIFGKLINIKKKLFQENFKAFTILLIIRESVGEPRFSHETGPHSEHVIWSALRK